MALVKCKECGKEMSSEAKACPNCGAPPLKKTSVLAWVLLALIAIGVVKCVAEDAGRTTSTNAAGTGAPAPAAPPTAEQQRLANYSAAFHLDQKRGRQWLADRLLEFCEKQDRHLNYITVAVRGNAIYCMHDFYTKYALSSGSRGPALGEWTANHRALLEQNKITRVGVWGKGDYASGAWFEVKP